MDLCTLDSAIRNPIFSSSIPDKSSLSRKLGALEIRFQKRKLSTSGFRSLVVRATSNKSNDDSSASGKGLSHFIFIWWIACGNVTLHVWFWLKSDHLSYKKIESFGEKGVSFVLETQVNSVLALNLCCFYNIWELN